MERQSWRELQKEVYVSGWRSHNHHSNIIDLFVIFNNRLIQYFTDHWSTENLDLIMYDIKWVYLTAKCCEKYIPEQGQSWDPNKGAWCSSKWTYTELIVQGKPSGWNLLKFWMNRTIAPQKSDHDVWIQASTKLYGTKYY